MVLRSIPLGRRDLGVEKLVHYRRASPQALDPAGTVVVTAGAWMLVIRSPDDLAIRAVCGQMLLRARPGALRCNLLQRDRCLAFRHGRCVLADSAVEDVTTDGKSP